MKELEKLTRKKRRLEIQNLELQQQEIKNILDNKMEKEVELSSFRYFKRMELKKKELDETSWKGWI